MNLGIMQPYFFPYIGYYSLIQATDLWVVFDTPQYIKKGWVNRNRVLKKNGGIKYIGIPVKSFTQSTPINEIKIVDEDWKENIINQLDHYKLIKAPRYDEVVEMMRKSFDIKTNNLCDVLINCLKISCQYLDIKFDYRIYSDLMIDDSNVEGPGDWALVISKKLGADCYINPPGGMEIFDKQKFEKAQIKIKFLKNKLQDYNQKNEIFEPGLSIIDVMMFNKNEDIKEILNCYDFI